MLDGEDLQQSIQSMLRSTIENAIRGHMGEQKHMTAEEFREATALFHTMFLLPDELRLTDEELQGYTADGLVDLVMEKAQAVYQRKEQEFDTAPDAGAGAGHHAAGGGRVLDGPDRRHE